jgi:hypothetical protein
MECPCSTEGDDYQPAPLVGSQLARNMNTGFEEIASLLISEQDSVAYCYVVRSIATENGVMVQKGSGPNFQGGYMTLCTCKWQMRTYRSTDDWRNVWIVGLAGSKAKTNHAIFYMMKVLVAFESYRELFYSNVLPQDTIRAKAADIHRLGDIYQPLADHGDPFSPDAYVPPIANHSHAPDQWHKDINYFNPRTGRNAALLVGDPEFSFLWEVPRILPSFRLGRGERKRTLNQFERWFKEA